MSVHIPVPDRFRSQAYLAVIADDMSTQYCVFAEHALVDMQKFAEQGYPNEICGLLIGKSTSYGWHIAEVKQVTNLNQERATDRFQLDPAGYQQIDAKLRGSEHEIVGVFHSHPDCPGQPSPTDLSSAWEGFVYPIISVCAGKVAETHCWVLTDDTAMGGRFQKLPYRS